MIDDAKRHDLVFKAKLADNSDRHEEMLQLMTSLAREGVDFTEEERTLYSVACKNTIKARRSSWRILSSILQKEVSKDEDSPRNANITREYLSKVEQEVKGRCNETIEILEKYLIPNTTNAESKVYFHKMIGDHYRYLAEFEKDKDSSNSLVVGAAKKAYGNAIGLLSSGVRPTSPVALGLALNYSVFCYEILKSPKTACEVALKAFNDALGDLKSLSGEDYTETASILSMLKDNLTIWTIDYLPRDG
mmetsp:Transcript_13953/g.39670  ORF Transcript_13953/g.39670 Transcript_13953/m.39670 type:complete len:248 (+) Transcript_13953:45-788(+)|eukprot:CAMPEP_0119125940 /NCGR_PEP_ID=MMETSP1310-20130426/5047_1 /TAXON_ID=464262 /ORGANISM="Genus nov. species nov., Strain RCC2339" /LENGTH=247 /DNA_ID=CAMNT_0007116061 /DNA_START=39 /DNA_END=782 /DNA_ORIENTATION=-